MVFTGIPFNLKTLSISFVVHKVIIKERIDRLGARSITDVLKMRFSVLVFNIKSISIIVCIISYMCLLLEESGFLNVEFISTKYVSNLCHDFRNSPSVTPDKYR